MTALAQDLQEHQARLADAFDIEAVTAHLCDAGGGCEIVYDSAWLQIGVYALFAPEPDQQRTNSNNALYVVVEGRGLLDVEGEQIELGEGHAAFVPAGANYRFSAYEQLSVVVISQKGRDDVQRNVVTPLKARLEPQAKAAD
jgi:mannose-6-phosphate isomerase-like protein (cupin superfamily)